MVIFNSYVSLPEGTSNLEGVLILNPQSSFSLTQCAGADSPDPSDRIAGISIAEGVGENQFYPALESSWLTVFWHKKEK
jgi:hypothetical protein